MKILAIETSCDETGIALIQGDKVGRSFQFKTLKETLLSQAALHAPYGGVYPNLAKREHQQNLPLLFEKFTDEEFDAIAVTVGPGLEPALWQGIVFAQELAKKTGKPLLPTNHMEAHLISSLVQPAADGTGILQHVEMPVLALLISGGHTEFVLMSEWFNYKVIGETLDDAVGECFDKVARMLGLPYPGGPEVSKLAATHRGERKKILESSVAKSGAEKSSFALPRPMLNTNNCDVSFSGLKTAALYALRDAGGIQKLSPDEIAAFAAEFEDAVGDVFIAKTRRALQESEAKTFVIGGGVAANRYLREKLEILVLEEFPDVEFRLPDLKITGDNAVMIAQAALTRRLSGVMDEKEEELKAVGNLSIAS